MKDWETKLAPALVAVAILAAAVTLAVLDHAHAAAAMALVGLVAQTFLPPAVRKVPPSERITDPEGYPPLGVPDHVEEKEGGTS